MGNELVYIVVNSSLYILLFVYYIWKRGINITTAPLLLWTISSLAAIYYYTSEDRYHVFIDDITMTPFIYLFLLVWISFLPLLRYKYKRIRIIRVNNTIYNALCWIIILMSFWVFFQNVHYFITHMLNPAAYLEQYQNKMNGVDLEILTGFSAYIMRYCKYLKGLIPFFFIFSFTSFVRTSKMVKIGLLIALLNLFINYMNTASRFALLTDLMLMVFLYFFMYRFYNKETKRIVNKMGLIIGGGLIFAISIITLQRFGKNSEYSKSMEYSLSLYAGESFLNFNGDMWNMQNFANGENCFAYFKDKIEGKRLCGRDYLKLERKVHRRMNVYYSFIGDYYTDFGRFWTVIIVILLSWSMCHYFKAHSIIGLGDLLIFSSYVKILLLGITYWTYLNYTMEIVVNIVIAILLNINQNIHRSISNVQIENKN